MSLLLETICIKAGIPLHLAYHEARMQKSTNKSFCLLPEILAKEPLPAQDLVKCRILYEQNIEYVEFQEYIPNPPKTLRLIEAPHLAYPHKYANRSTIEALKKKKQGTDDILITQKGYLTDTSYCNIALFDGICWVTPKVPLLEGTARARLIDESKIFVTNIHITDLKQFSKVRLFNAMLDFEAGYEATLILGDSLFA